MADWYPLQYWRSRCPEIVRVSSATKRTRHETLGIMCDFWSWASTESDDGRIDGISIDSLADIIGADLQFWQAVASVGWLEFDSTGLVVPNWDRWLSESSKKRVKEAERKRAVRFRETSAQKRTNRGQIADEKRPTGQDRTEHKEEEKTPPSADLFSHTIPRDLDTPEFRAAWEDLAEYRRDQKWKPWKAKTTAAKLAEMATWGVGPAIDAIRATIANGWQGVFRPREIGKSGSADEQMFDQIREVLGDEQPAG